MVVNLSEFQNALRISDADVAQVVAERTRGTPESCPGPSSKHVKLGHGVEVPVILTQPGGNQSRVLIRAIVVSPTGVAALHGGFVHTGTKATLYFPTPDGETFMIDGEVQRATHRKGRIHELGIGFAQRIDVSIITGEDEDEAKAPGAPLTPLQAAIASLGQIASRIAGAAVTAKASNDLTPLMRDLLEAWDKTIEAEAESISSQAAKSASDVETTVIASASRKLADAIEQGKPVAELLQMFEQLNSSIHSLEADLAVVKLAEQAKALEQETRNKPASQANPSSQP